MKTLFDSNKEEKRGLTFPLERLNIVTHGLMYLQNGLAAESISKQERAALRYGKVQHVSRQLFDTKFTPLLNEKSARVRPVLVDIPKPELQTVKTAPKETILDSPIELDPLQFRLMLEAQKAEEAKEVNAPTSVPTTDAPQNNSDHKEDDEIKRLNELAKTFAEPKEKSNDAIAKTSL